MISLKGCKALHVSREQIRAHLCASIVVLAYHNRTPKLPLVVTLKMRMKDAGLYHGNSRISLHATLNGEDMLTTIIHEVIHACIDFPKGTEKCTSTLCGKIKEDVYQLSEILLQNTYQRAAYIAHTKIAYVPKADDFYDDDQWDHVGVKPKYKRRSKRNTRSERLTPGG